MHPSEFEHQCTEIAHAIRVLVWTVEDRELQTAAPEKRQMLVRDLLIQAAGQMETAKVMLDDAEKAAQSGG